MLSIILIWALLMLPLKGTDGQKIVFDSLNLTTPCSRGLRSGIDKFMFTGTVEGNYSALVSSNWPSSVIVQILVSKSTFTKMCEIFIGIGGFFCNPSSTDICYCDHLNTTTDSVHFVVSLPAQQNYSEGVIRAEWKKLNGPVVHSLNNVTLPTIYDAKKANISLKVKDVPANQTSVPFGANFVSNKNNTVEVCCINSASPCYLKMSFNGQIFENQPSCLNYTVFVPNVNYTATVTTSYSMCTTTDYNTAVSGVITTVEESVSSTTTETAGEVTTTAAGTTEVPTTLRPSTSSATAHGKQGSEKDNIPLIVCLSVIIPIVVIALCVAAVYYYKKNKKKSKAVTNGGTNESRPKENKQEGHETNETAPKDQDGQPSAGYVNHGFDRRTSPSSITVDTTQDNTPQQRTFKEKNGSNKQFTGKTNGSASKDTPGEPRQLPPVRGTHSHGYLQQPRGQSRPASVEMTSSAKKQPSAGYVNHGFDRRTSPSSITVDTTQDNTPQQRTFKEKNGSNKQFTGKTNGSASKDTPGEPRQLPPVRGTHSHGYLQQPRGQSRPASVEMTSSAKK